MATVTFTPLMLRGAGTRGVPLIPKSGGGGGDTGLATVSNAFSMEFDGTNYVNASSLSSTLQSLTVGSISMW